MRENNLRRLWAEGKCAINGWCAIPSAYLAEIMAHEDFDSVTVDVQHGMIHFETALGMFQAISTTNATPLARAPWNEPGILMKLLDAGAWGIICPMINSREECEAFVGACHYPPDGYRSLSAVRAGLYGGPDYRQKSNETILTIAMIETRKALDNLKEIVTVPGLDAVFIGPNDLAFSMGYEPKPEPQRPRGHRSDRHHPRGIPQGRHQGGHPRVQGRGREGSRQRRLRLRLTQQRLPVPRQRRQGRTGQGLLRLT